MNLDADQKTARLKPDRAVERLYRAAAFKSDRDRVEYLFARDETLCHPLPSA